MPTTLPDRAGRSPNQRRRLLAEFAPIFAPMAAAVLYLLLLAWSLVPLAADFSAPLRPDRLPGELNSQLNGDYNPMEPGHRTQGPHWPGWLAHR
jgi:hypothetical protein